MLLKVKASAFWAFVLHFSTVAAIPHQLLRARDSPLPPSEDPFYQPPAGFEVNAPGTILKSRLVTESLGAFNVYPRHFSKAYQLLYRTTDTFGNPEAAVTTVLVPLNADHTKLLSYQFPEDSAELNCAPSYSLQQEADSPTAFTNAQILLLNIVLSKGWYITVPDYEGPKAAFSAGIQSGHATLDSLRATLLSTDLTQISPEAKAVLVGYSGGSIPTTFAAQLQPSYAPDLNDSLIGAVAGGVIANGTATVLATDNTIFSGFGFGGLLGLSQEYPYLAKYLSEHLIPETAERLRGAGKLCLSDLVIEYSDESISDYADNGLAALQDPGVVAILKENTMGEQTPTIPMFLYHTVLDQVSPIAAVDTLVDKYCTSGGRIQYYRDEDSEHISMAFNGVPDSLLWISDLFEGIPAPQGCLIEDVTLTLKSSLAASILGADYLHTLLEIVAPSDSSSG